jgi:hypothetical protein
MTRATYFHRALFAPIVIVLAGSVLLFLIRPESTLPVILVAFHAIVGVPYVIIAVLLRWWTRRWPGARLARGATLLPLLVAPVAGLALAVAGLDWEPSSANPDQIWADGALGWFMLGSLVALAEGYAYVWMVRLGDRVRRRRRIVRARGAGRPVPGTAS